MLQLSVALPQDLSYLGMGLQGVQGPDVMLMSEDAHSCIIEVYWTPLYRFANGPDAGIRLYAANGLLVTPGFAHACPSRCALYTVYRPCWLVLNQMGLLM